MQKTDIFVSETITKNALDEAGVILCKINYINELNSEKYFSVLGLTTTETLEFIDITTLYEVAAQLKVPVKLPNKEIPTPHILLEYPWGAMVILAMAFGN